MSKNLASFLRFSALFASLFLVFGCQSEEEKSNEAAIQSRNNQAAHMGHAGAPSGPNVPAGAGSPPSSASAGK